MKPVLLNRLHLLSVRLQNRLRPWFGTIGGEYRSSGFQQFLHNLGLVFGYRMLGAGCSTVIAILAARCLGPAGYGEIGLVNNIATILLLPVMAGINVSMYKYLPAGKPEENKPLITAAWCGNTVLMLFFAILYFSVGAWVQHRVKIPLPVWRLGIWATIILNLGVLSESFLRGQKKYAPLSTLKLASNLLFAALFLLGLAFYKTMDVQRYLLLFFSSQLVFSLMAFCQSEIHPAPITWPVVKRVYGFGLLNMLNGLLLIFNNYSDLFILNYFSPGKAVGIYAVYQGFAKNLFAILFYEVFAVVFMPTIAGMNKKQLYQTVQKGIPALWLGIVVVTTGFIAVIAGLSGKDYGVNLGYAFLVASGTGFYTIFQIYLAIFSMEGTYGATFCLIPAGITLPVSLLIQYGLAKYYGICGMMVAVTVTNLLLVLSFILVIRWFYREFPAD